MIISGYFSTVPKLFCMVPEVMRTIVALKTHMRKSQRTKCNEFRHAFRVLTGALDELGGAFEWKNLVKHIL
jgi:hypothetical protein